MENNGNYSDRKRVICAICGVEIEGKIQKKYCQPPAVYKWLEQTLEPVEAAELKKMILSRDNVIYAHKYCKKELGDNKVNINALYLPQFKRAKCRELYEKINPYFNSYRNIRGHICVSQNRKCYKCGCDIKEKNTVIRRIDPHKPRTEENACLVCHTCDGKYLDFTDVGTERMQETEY